MRIFLVLALVVAFLAIIFALQNASAITVTIGVWQITASLALILLLTIGLGLLSGLMVSMPAIIRHNVRVARHQRQIVQLEATIDQLNQELTHQKALLAQAHEDIAEQQTRLESRTLPSAIPQPLLFEAQALDEAELIDEAEEWT